MSSPSDYISTSVSIAAGKINSLNDQLANLARHIENESSDKVFASILLLDESDKKLFRGAAPSLPEEYSNKIDGIEIGPKVGSCGTAAFFGHAVFVVDIELDELWAPYKDLAEAHGLRACWSVPIVSKKNNVLGTFALYYTTIKNPSAEDRQFIEECAQTAADLIEKSGLVK